MCMVLLSPLLLNVTIPYGRVLGHVFPQEDGMDVFVFCCFLSYQLNLKELMSQVVSQVAVTRCRKFSLGASTKADLSLPSKLQIPYPAFL